MGLAKMILGGIPLGFANRWQDALSHTTTAIVVLPCGQLKAVVWSKRVAQVCMQRRCQRYNLICCRIQPLQSLDKVKKFAPLMDSTTLQSDTMAGIMELRAVPDIWRTAAEKYGDRIALVDPHHQPPTQLTYAKLEEEILDFAEGVRASGISPEEKIAIFADNSCHWLVADQGIMATGAINVVRGSRSSIEELHHVYMHSDSVALIIDNVDLFNKLAPILRASTTMKFVVILWGETSSVVKEHDGEHTPIYTYGEFLARGQECRKDFLGSNNSISRVQGEAIQPRDVATIVYTSGTSGNPKGVLLTHANLLHQIIHLRDAMQPMPGERFLSILPPWHMYERSAEYFALARGIELVYTNVKSLKDDLKYYPPDYFVSVPLVFDILYRGIQKQLSSGSNARKLIAFSFISISMLYMELKRIYEGKSLARAKHTQIPVVAVGEWILARIVATLFLPLHVMGKSLVYSKVYAAIGIRKAGISGGGSLPPHVDKFFEAIGITLINGYGLTESSPVVSARAIKKNILGTVGMPLRCTEIKVVHLESGEILPDGTKGLIKLRGPQVMRGYYKNHAATSNVLDESGWLDTGDIGWLVPKITIGAARFCGGNLVLEGRAKDTIVLSTGENVEPAEIEEAALQSNLIQQIVVVGQDQRRLGALIVPNMEQLKLTTFELMKARGRVLHPTKDGLTILIRSELNKYTAKCSVPVGPFVILDEAFTIENGLLTPTMKNRRNAIMKKYHFQIKALFGNFNL